MQSTGQTSTHAESFVPMHGSVMTKGMPVSLYRNQRSLSLDELDQVLRCTTHEKSGPTACVLVGAGTILEPHDLRIPETSIEDLDRLAPQLRIVQARRERDVDAFLTPGGVLRMIEKHHVLFEVR